jgi:4-amino-4-deoxy-L-arabinose transferase-like glycosyltransferase
MASKKPAPDHPPAGELAVHDWRLAVTVAAVLLLARLAYLLWFCPYGLNPDEAQYWSWLLHPAWSYASKPPLTTALIGLATTLFGTAEASVRLPALLGQAAALLLAFALARRLGGRSRGRAAGWWALLLFTVTPITGFGGLFISPDATLVPLYLAALLLLTREVDRPYTLSSHWLTGSLAHWLAIGLLVGLAGLAKYSAAFFFPLAGLFLLMECCFFHSFCPTPRAWAYFLLAGLLALALQIPVLAWNAHHHWAGLFHVLWQANAHDPRHGGPATLLGFLLGQLGAFGPVTAVFMAAAAGAGITRLGRLPPSHRLLVVFIVPLFALFTLETLTTKVQVNWPILATVPALILLASWLPSQSPLVQKTAKWGALLSLILTLALHNLPALGLSHTLKPVQTMLGARQMGRMTGYLLAKVDPSTVVLATRYQTLAQLAFYTPGQPTFIYLNDGDNRLNQYDFWPWPNLKGRLVLYVTESRSQTLPDVVKARFSPCQFVTHVAIKQGERPLRDLTYYLCAGK